MTNKDRFNTVVNYFFRSLVDFNSFDVPIRPKEINCAKEKISNLLEEYDNAVYELNIPEEDKIKKRKELEIAARRVINLTLSEQLNLKTNS